MSDEMPAEPVKKKAAPGWYRHPSQEGLLRYWGGAAWTDEVKPSAKPNNNRRWLVLGVLALTAILAGAYAISGAGERSAAEDYCKERVEDRLKSPATAEFSDMSVSNEDEEYTVYGDVDSENGFGAMVRTSFRCELKHLSGDNFYLTDMWSSEDGDE